MFHLFLAGEAMTTASFIADIGTFFTGVLSWVVETAQTIASTPMLFVPFMVPLLFVAVALLRRISAVRA